MHSGYFPLPVLQSLGQGYEGKQKVLQWDRNFRSNNFANSSYHSGPYLKISLLGYGDDSKMGKISPPFQWGINALWVEARSSTLFSLMKWYRFHKIDFIRFCRIGEAGLIMIVMIWLVGLALLWVTYTWLSFHQILWSILQLFVSNILSSRPT